MRVLICGGRTLSPAKVCVWLHMNASRVLGTLPEAVIYGGAPGGDEGVEQWAAAAGIPVEVYRADWREYGKAAGPIRNRRMLTEGKPDVVLALPGGIGTRNMVELAETDGVRVIKVTLELCA